jgi:hypothetical protein
MPPSNPKGENHSHLLGGTEGHLKGDHLLSGLPQGDIRTRDTIGITGSLHPDASLKEVTRILTGSAIPQDRITKGGHQGRTPKGDHQDRITKENLQGRITREGHQDRTPKGDHQDRTPKGDHQDRIIKGDLQGRITKEDLQGSNSKEGIQGRITNEEEVIPNSKGDLPKTSIVTPETNTGETPRDSTTKGGWHRRYSPNDMPNLPIEGLHKDKGRALFKGMEGTIALTAEGRSTVIPQAAFCAGGALRRKIEDNPLTSPGEGMIRESRIQGIRENLPKAGLQRAGSAVWRTG